MFLEFIRTNQILKERKNTSCCLCKEFIYKASFIAAETLLLTFFVLPAPESCRVNSEKYSGTLI